MTQQWRQTEQHKVLEGQSGTAAATESRTGRGGGFQRGPRYRNRDQFRAQLLTCGPQEWNGIVRCPALLIAGVLVI